MNELGNGVPTEVELVYEVMPCNALRTAQEPAGHPHACTYFRKWGTYHSYDYEIEGPPPQRGIVQKSKYVGRAALVPEVLSGCRKAPILALGINPNLPGWWPDKRRSLNPLFDDYKQYAHYFRYRAVAKLELTEAEYQRYGGGPHDTPFSDFELKVPQDAHGDRTISVELQPQKMYETYQLLLDALAHKMNWADHQLTVGEDLAYGNMVASPSAKWTTTPSPTDPSLPPMSEQERAGIVAECFVKRQYFLRQLFQSLSPVLLVFSQSTASALIQALQTRFISGSPRPDEAIDRLGERNIRLLYGKLPDGRSLEARVIFAPHITGDPADFEAARERVVTQLVEEAVAGNIGFNPQTKHLARPPGACVFCPLLEIGPCDYLDELRPISSVPRLTADSSLQSLGDEKAAQEALMKGPLGGRSFESEFWVAPDDGAEPNALRER